MNFEKLQRFQSYLQEADSFLYEADSFLYEEIPSSKL